jgi:hypothetical protein
VIEHLCARGAHSRVAVDQFARIGCKEADPYPVPERIALVRCSPSWERHWQMLETSALPDACQAPMGGTASLPGTVETIVVDVAGGAVGVVHAVGVVGDVESVLGAEDVVGGAVRVVNAEDAVGGIVGVAYVGSVVEVVVDQQNQMAWIVAKERMDPRAHCQV